MADIFHLPDSSDSLSLSSKSNQSTGTLSNSRSTSESASPLETVTHPDSIDSPLVPHTATPTMTSTSRTSATRVVATSSKASNTSAAAANSESVIPPTSDAKSGASPAALGITITLLIVSFIGAAFFLFRRYQRKKRMARQRAWQLRVGSPKLQPKMYDVEKALPDGDGHAALMDNFETIDIDEKRGPTPLPDNLKLQTVPVKLPTHPGALHPAGLAPPRMPSPPPLDLPGGNSPGFIGVEAPSFGSGGPMPLITATPFSATINIPRSSVTPSLSSPVNAQITTGTLVTVARTFIPTLQDELSIQTGELVRILTMYDDGWVHVESLRSGVGENGVVPVECLEVVSSANSPILPPIFPGAGLTQEAVESWRLSKRKSSLHPVGPAMY